MWQIINPYKLKGLYQDAIYSHNGKRWSHNIMLTVNNTFLILIKGVICPSSWLCQDEWGQPYSMVRKIIFTVNLFQENHIFICIHSHSFTFIYLHNLLKNISYTWDTSIQCRQRESLARKERSFLYTTKPYHRQYQTIHPNSHAVVLSARVKLVMDIRCRFLSCLNYHT